MKLEVIDAFADRPFAGNPAAVCVTSGPLEDMRMRRIAREMSLSETAFLHAVPGGFSLRWFTPLVEVALCGHATLAAAHALWTGGVLRADETARFQTLSGELVARKEGDWIELDFPALPAEAVLEPAGLVDGLGLVGGSVVAAARSTHDFLVELADEAAVRGLRPDFGRLAAVPGRGVIVTAQAETPGFDFVSRFFAPNAGVNEDPVTGSAHCALGPYWQARLGRSEFTAYQASERGGVVKVAVRGERVLLKGQAVTVSRVELTAAAASFPLG
ncbi:MAG: PhzF family phenazine biosynthesis protein [Verrucomicrobia bacterium]|nr:PhzF family phenazine biosynthesis protein [Verrucomicrobiota bacterium]